MRKLLSIARTAAALPCLLCLLSDPAGAAYVNTATAQGNILSVVYDGGTCLVEMSTGEDPFTVVLPRFDIAQVECAELLEGDCISASGQSVAILTVYGYPANEVEMAAASWQKLPASGCF